MKKLQLFTVLSAFVIVLAFSGCELFQKVEDVADTTAPPETETVTVAETETEFEYSKDPDDYVEVAMEEEYGNGETYVIPKITLDSKDAKIANEEILDIYEPIFNVRGEVDSSYRCTDISYTPYVSNEILSVLVSAEYNGNAYYHTLYTFDLRDGSALTPSKFIKKLGLDEEQFYKDLKKAVEEDFKDRFYDSFSDDPDYEDCLEKTLDDNNLADSNFFLNDDGLIRALVPMYYVTDLRLHYAVVGM